MSRWPPRPRLSSTFFKGHGLGNDYLVFTAQEDGWPATPGNVARVCERHTGVGSDGIVVAPPGGDDVTAAPRRLRMFNPDGGEFERSGNGLRVFGAWVAIGEPALPEVRAEVAGDVVRLQLHGREGAIHDVSVEMGRAVLGPAAVAMAGRDGVVAEAGSDPQIAVPGPAGTRLGVVPVSVGNPHLVVLTEDGHPLEPTEAHLGRIGPFLATHPSLEHGTNVQLARPAGPAVARALIWERGVGRTSASGTSACAVAVALVATGRVEPGEVRVEMPGGTLRVTVSPDLDVILRGPVEEVFDGRLSEALLATFEREP